MSLVDNLLLAAGASQSAPPAPGSGAVGAPPAQLPGAVGGAPAATPAAAPIGATPSPIANPGGALGQAMQLMTGARQAAAQDPTLQTAQQVMTEDIANRDQLAQAVDANIGKMDAIRATPRPGVPEAPELAQLPEAPVPEKKNPLRVFGQIMPMIVALGALATRQPALNSINAATAMVNAAKANDKEEEARQRRIWADNLKTTVDNNQLMLKNYELVLNNRDLSVRERQAQLAELAASNQDLITSAAIKSGKFEAVAGYHKLMQGATNQIAELSTNLQAAEAKAEAQRQDQLVQMARLQLDAIRAGRVSPGEVISPIIQEVAEKGTAALTPEKVQALETYFHYVQGGGGAGVGGATGGAVDPFGGMLGGGAPAPAAPGGPTPRPVPPPVAPKPAMAAPQNPKDRKVGVVYGTPRGPLKWTGVPGKEWASP